MNYKEGEVWVLDDGKEYIIVKTLDIGVHHYALLLTNEEPIQMKLGSMQEHDGEVTFHTTNNKEQALYILESMIYQTQ